MALADIAREAGTPAYVYSSAAILGNYRAYDEALAGLPHTVCYAVKANSTLAVLALLAKAGAGFDIVSGGELYRVLQAGGDAARVVFSGVGKTAAEVDYALGAGIRMFNCESEAELGLIDALAARRGLKASFSIRVNPDVDAATHPYISTGLREHKFGIDMADAEGVYERARGLENMTAQGVSCHIGSQLMDMKPLLEAIDRLLGLVERLRGRGFEIGNLDLGGGLGVAYQAHERSPQIREFIEQVRGKVAGRGLHVAVEPGRSIVGPAGVLLTRVLYRKYSAGKDFVIVDAAMNDLIRPAFVPFAPRDPAAAEERASGDCGGRSGSGVRDGRFSSAGTQDGECRAGRLPGGGDGGGVRVCAGVELQFASAAAGGSGRGQHVPGDSRARDIRGPGAGRDGVKRAAVALALAAQAAMAHETITTKLLWTQEICRIVNRHCVSCHRDGGTAMSLANYDDARPWAKAIRDEVLSRRMPPWGPVKGVGEFRDDPSLSQVEIDMIVNWVEGGAPKGDDVFLPAAPKAAATAEKKPAGHEFTVTSAGAVALPAEMKIAGLRPVQVVAGESLEVTAYKPDGAVERLIWIRDWRQGWARTFYFARPVHLPAGTKVAAYSGKRAEAALVISGGPQN